MTVQSQTSRADYTGNGLTTNFPVPFYWLQDSDLLVIRTDNGFKPPTVATLALGTDYVVTGSGNPAGGSITTTVAPTSTQKLSILRNVPFTQLTHYVPNDPFPAASHERALDKLTMETQQLNEGLSRSITLPPNITGVSTALPTPVANNFIGWNPTATALQNVDPTTVATSVTYGNAVADKFSGDGTTTNFNLSANPGGINNLGVSIGGVTQRPGIDYNWTAGTTLSFTTAPPTGANNILVRYTQALPIGAAAAGNVAFDNTTLDQQFLRRVNRVVDSIAALRSLSKNVYTRAFVTGYYTAGDGGGGPYAYDPSDTKSADNGGTIIVANDGGRWKLTALHFVTVHQFGGYGDAQDSSPHDDTAAIRNAVSWAASSGRTLRVTAMHAFSGTITIDSTLGGDVGAGGRRISIIGNGKSNSGFVFTGNTNIDLFVFNGNYKDVPHFEGFRIQRKDAASEFGYGLKINNTVGGTVRGLKMFRLDTGLVFNDCNSMLVDDCDITYCGMPFDGHFTNTSVPNAITFSNCSFNSNIRGGPSIIGGVTNVFLNCRFEGNGIDDNGNVVAGAKALYVRTNNPVNTNFMSALLLLSCYFEGNAGDADVYLDCRGATTFNDSGTLYNRTHVTRYVVNNIVFDGSSMSGGANPVAINMSSSFTSQGSYVPDPNRKAINYLRGASYSGFQINDNNIYQNAVEVPLVDPAKDLLRGDAVKVLAMGSVVGSNGTLVSNYGVVSCTRNSVGDYTIVTKSEAANIFASWNHISSGGLSGLIPQIVSRTANSIRVRWMNPSLTLQDPIQFDFVLFKGF